MSVIFTPNAKFWFYGRDDSPTDHLVIKETWVENVYQIVRKDLDDTGILVDIGANIGAVSIWAAALNDDLEKPVVKVFAVEPEPDNLNVLRANISRNGARDFITVCPYAITDHGKDVFITNHHGDSRLTWSDTGTKVPSMRLIDFFDNNGITYVDVLKMDIEGSEYEIIEDADEDTLKKIRYLTMEFDAADDEKFGRLITKLAKHFQIHTLGSPERGGYLYCRRYD